MQVVLSLADYSSSYILVENSVIKIHLYPGTRVTNNQWQTDALYTLAI